MGFLYHPQGGNSSSGSFCGQVAVWSLSTGGLSGGLLGASHCGDGVGGLLALNRRTFPIVLPGGGPTGLAEEDNDYYKFLAHMVIALYIK